MSAARKASARRGSSRHRLVFDRTPERVTTPLSKAFKSVWQRLRRGLLQEHGLICMACGYVPPVPGELEAHEIHSYPGDGVIKLEAIVLLCRKCHHTIHLERSVSWARDRARWKWMEENPPPNRRASWPTGEVLQAMVATVGKAETIYREEMLTHLLQGKPRHTGTV